MRKLAILFVFALMLSVISMPAGVQASTDQDDACWGQATAVFAQMGEMGKHASQQPTPRIGLKNLAVALHDAGAINEPTLQALGAFVAADLGLEIDACMD